MMKKYIILTISLSLALKTFTKILIFPLKLIPRALKCTILKRAGYKLTTSPRSSLRFQFFLVGASSL